MIKKYAHVIWDWNGTLFNDAELCADVFSNVLKKYGLRPVTIEKYREIFTFPVRNYYETAGFDFGKHSFEEVGREWMDEYEERKNSCGLFQDTVEVLSYIKSLGIRQYILSAYPEESLIQMVRFTGIENYFSRIVGLDHIYATGKTDLGLKLVKQINTGGKILFLGDTVHDFEVAEAIGADCILISNGHQAESKLLETGTIVLDRLSALINKNPDSPGENQA